MEKTRFNIITLERDTNGIERLHHYVVLGYQLEVNAIHDYFILDNKEYHYDKSDNRLQKIYFNGPFPHSIKLHELEVNRIYPRTKYVENIKMEDLAEKIGLSVYKS